MKLSFAFSDEPTQNESLLIENKLGQSKFTVYKTYSTTRKQSYALKTFQKTPYGIEQFQKEKLMCHLNHKNVIKSIPIRCQHEKINVLLFEYAKYGDFFKLVTGGLLSNEILVRTYFTQLINGLEYIHAHGLAHLDLKLENILMGNDFQLKIADFDLAQPIVETLLDSMGTAGYRAPEVIDNTARNLAAIDVYSCAIILYTFKAKEFLFVEMEEGNEDNILNYARYKKSKETYWTERMQRKQKRFELSDDLIELLNGMLEPQPAKRLTIKQIKNSNWFKGPTLNNDELRKVMVAKLE
jgi:serine/threonine protein kinase